MIIKDPMLKMLIAHASTDQTRFHLNAIHYDDINYVATDGHRLLSVRKSTWSLPHAIAGSYDTDPDIDMER